MSLLDLWKSSKAQLLGKSVQQIISFAGEGRLLDKSKCSAEFREYLSYVTPDTIEEYIGHCLNSSFQDSGIVLQDIVNQIGRRLGFDVEDGKYRGNQKEIGYDGFWRSTDGRAMVIEVKTTDAYLIDLDRIAAYRKALSEEKKFNLSQSSILMVVGRNDTVGLESQIRGSRHAWDIRVISAEALLKLMHLKHETDDPTLHKRISSILVPQEYTRLDGIVDLAFATAEEVQSAASHPHDNDDDTDTNIEPKERNEQKRSLAVNFHEVCKERIAAHLKTAFVRESRSVFKSIDGDVWLSCAVSKEHTRGGIWYWFAFHPAQKEQLEAAKTAYVAFGCGSPDLVILVPFKEFSSWLPTCNQTEQKNERYYWHVHIKREGNRLLLHQKAGGAKVDVTKFVLGDIS